MNLPIISFITYSEQIPEPRTGTAMQCWFVDKVPEIKHGDKGIVQFQEGGYRMAEVNRDISKWSNVTNEDIDWKNWLYFCEIYSKEIEDPVITYMNVCKYLLVNYHTLFLYSEMSRSKKGFHFWFRWNCERTEENFEKYKRLSYWLIHRAFEKLGYSEGINLMKGHEGDKGWGNVHDKCTNSYYQLCYMTQINSFVNKNCSGYIPDNLEESLDIPNEESKVTFNNDQSGEMTITNVKINDIKNVDYIEHHIRWSLFDSLMFVFGEEYVKEQWIRCCKMIPELNGHDVNFYINEPDKNKWYKRYNEEKHKTCNINLLKQFGYDIQFKIKQKQNSRLENLLQWI